MKNGTFDFEILTMKDSPLPFFKIPHVLKSTDYDYTLTINGRDAGFFDKDNNLLVALVAEMNDLYYDLGNGSLYHLIHFEENNAGMLVGTPDDDYIKIWPHGEARPSDGFSPFFG